MFVKKFEADTLEEALKAVKVELGPDAIILKTITNNGLKGAFKKKRIEITAAISERNYEKKAKVDKVLNPNQKEALYQKPATAIKETIQKYNAPETVGKPAGNYGGIGLNKVVNTISRSSSSLTDVTSKTSSMIKNSLDDFLTSGEVEQFDDSEEIVEIKNPKRVPPKGKYSEPPANTVSPRQGLNEREATQDQIQRREVVSVTGNTVNREAYNELKMEMRTQQLKIELLEKKIQELMQNYNPHEKNLNDAEGVYQLRTTLKTLDIDDTHILELIKKANYELSRDDLENPDIVFEFALKEMASSINTAIPLFAKIDNANPVITVLLSEAASGQSSMATKIAVLKKDVVVVQYSQDGHNNASADFAAQVFGFKVETVHNMSEVMGVCRKSIELGKSVIIDVRLNGKVVDESKKFIESLRRGFNNVEILCTLSAIHAELYNRKILARYKDLLDGVIISHVDLCMNFGAIFNVHKSHNKIPMKFFGTGPVVPDDIEAATAERLMAGLFQF